jgi:serine/threonine protein kinase
VHRDVKLDNVMLSKDKTTIALGDFGIASEFRVGEKVTDRSGTPAYLAPEVHAGKEYDPVAAEIWSLGVCLFVMLTGYLPFTANDARSLKNMILAGSFIVPSRLSMEASALIHSMLDEDPRRRPALREIL